MEPVRTYTTVLSPSAVQSDHQFGPFILPKLPPEWVVIQESSMRQITILHGEKGTDAFDMSFSQFPGPMPNLTENVNRWRKQLQLPPQSEAEVSQALQFDRTHAQDVYVAIAIKNANKCMHVALFEREKATVYVKYNGNCDAIQLTDFDALIKGLTFDGI